MGENGKAKNLLLGLGADLLVRIQGIEARLRSVLVGVKPDEYLIIETPRTKGIEARLRIGNRVTIIFIWAGTVHGFKSSIIGTIEKPAKVMFITFPEKVETHELRQSQRISCYLPAAMNLAGDDATYDGVILDISRLGCNFTSLVIPRQKTNLLQLGGTVELTFEVFGVEGKRRLSAEIMNLNLDDRTASIGVRFDAVDDELQGKIDSYVECVTEHFKV